jgi:hypothetical protein
MDKAGSAANVRCSLVRILEIERYPDAMTKGNCVARFEPGSVCAIKPVSHLVSVDHMYLCKPRVVVIIDSTIQVSGVFTLLGTGHDLTIPMQIHIDGSKATARAKFVVPYVQWGLKNPSFMFWKAENDVAVVLNLIGQISN